LSLIAAATVLLGAGLSIGVARAQANKMAVVFSDRKTEIHGSGEVVLRPNVSGQAIYAWIRNPTADDQEFTVQLKSAPGGEPLATGEAAVQAGKNAVIPFVFKKLAAPPPAAPGATAPATPEWPELPDGKLQITLTKKGSRNTPADEIHKAAHILPP